RVPGRVLAPGGEPAAGARVVLVPGPGRFVTDAGTGDLRFAEQATGERGTFAFDGVPPGEGYEVTASGAGFAISHATGIAVRAGEDALVTLRTRAGGSIAGRVVSSDAGRACEPVAGAHVGAIPRGLRDLRL